MFRLHLRYLMCHLFLHYLKNLKSPMTLILLMSLK
jgi:hypothetical protein